MEKKTIKINDKNITIMEQPTITVLEWEKKFRKPQLDAIGYIKQILKYPSGVNPEITEIFDKPAEIKVDDLIKKYDDKEQYLRECQRLLIIGQNDFAFIGEEFIKIVDKDINDFKFRDVQRIGKEVAEQIAFLFELISVIDTFRNL